MIGLATHQKAINIPQGRKGFLYRCDEDCLINIGTQNMILAGQLDRLPQDIIFSGGNICDGAWNWDWTGILLLTSESLSRHCTT